MRTLADRIKWLVEQSGANQRELARRSGLAGAHVGIILKRLEKNPQADIERTTLTALAKGGGVSIDWLATGEGNPAPSVEPPAVAIEAYPTRAEGARIAREDGIDDAAVESVLKEAVLPDQAKRSPLWWAIRMKRREVEILSPETPSGPDPWKPPPPPGPPDRSEGPARNRTGAPERRKSR